MRWLIDGYNVIRRDPGFRGHERESLEAGRRALLHAIAGVARSTGERFVVVFDGARTGGAAAGGPGEQVQVVFSRPPQTADDVLMRLAGQWRDAAVVVSSDRTVHDAARRAGAVAVTTEEFLAALDAAAPADDRDDEDEEEDEPGGDRWPKRGNPRRPSRAERATHRALRRLRPR